MLNRLRKIVQCPDTSVFRAQRRDESFRLIAISMFYPKIPFLVIHELHLNLLSLCSIFTSVGTTRCQGFVRVVTSVGTTSVVVLVVVVAIFF